MMYKEWVIPKKHGKTRKIAMPDKELLKFQRSKLFELQEHYMKQVVGTSISDTAHGFIKGRNVVTAAKKHIGFKATIMMDLSDFFDNVYKEMLPKKFRDSNFYHKKGYCAQGFATSPMLANIASIKMLKKLQTYLDSKYKKNVLTIYADDIQISLNTENHTKLNNIIAGVTKIIQDSGFVVNVGKTRIKYAKYGFRRILGVNVGDTLVRATRKTMRKIRAARHQSNGPSLGGLVNWSNCNLPNKWVAPK